MRSDYIFFETDSSFDFQGGTYYCTDKHGFSIEINADNKINIDSIEGFGAFEDAEKCETLETLFEYIEKNKGYVTENEDEDMKYTRLELLLELQQIIIQNVKEKIKEGYTPKKPLYLGLECEAA